MEGFWLKKFMRLDEKFIKVQRKLSQMSFVGLCSNFYGYVQIYVGYIRRLMTKLRFKATTGMRNISSLVKNPILSSILIETPHNESPSICL
jgi:hypothetical protein